MYQNNCKNCIKIPLKNNSMTNQPQQPRVKHMFSLNRMDACLCQENQVKQRYRVIESFRRKMETLLINRKQNFASTINVNFRYHKYLKLRNLIIEAPCAQYITSDLTAKLQYILINLILNIQLNVQMLDVPSSDLDFYKRKIMRLESDLADLQQQLSGARLRLRTAQDFQIKYDLLLRQSQHENHRLKMAEKAQEIRQQEITQTIFAQAQAKWQNKVKQKQLQVRAQYEQKIQKIYQQNKQQIKKIQQSTERSQKIDTLQFKVRKLQSENKSLQDQIDQMKFLLQNQKQQQIQALKDSYNTKIRQKDQSERKAHQSKIDEMESIIRNHQLQIQMHKMKQKPENINFILEKAKQQFNSRSNQISNQCEKLAAMLNQKVAEIEQLLNEKNDLENTIKTLRTQNKQNVTRLESILIEKEKQHKAELLNFRQRMSKIREEEVSELKTQIAKGQQTFNSERNSWQHIIQTKQQERNKLKHAFDQQRYKWDEQKLFLKKKIQEMKQRLKQLEGPRELGQTQQLLNSLRDLENKEDHFSNYENGVTFLERQLKKAILKLQSKHMEVKKLLKQISTLRQDFDHQQQELRQKFKLQKKQLNDKILKLESYSRQLNDTIRDRDKDIKKVKKDQQSKRQILQVENKNLKQFSEELQRDYNRIIQNKKTIEQSYRQERQKSIVSKSEINFTRRDKWLELQKQKNDLQVIFKEKQQQMKIAFELEKERLRVERDKLKQENQIIKHQKNLQDQQMRKIIEDKQNNKSRKMAEYSKKMATVDLQLALTQNLYDSLIQAKSRMRDSLEQHDSVRSQSDSEPRFKRAGDQIKRISQLEDIQSPMFNLPIAQSPVIRGGLLDSFGPGMRKNNNR